MSRDDGIYILKLKDQYRVKHLSAIENIDWSDEEQKFVDYAPHSIVRMFDNAKAFSNFDRASAAAVRLENEEDTEYGVKVIEYDKTWEGIVRDAGLNVSEEAPFNMDDFIYELNSLLNKYGVILEPDVYEDWDEDINGEYHLCSLEPYIVVEDNKTGVVYLETYSLPVGELVGDCIFK